MRAQRAILIVALLLGTAYAWLSGSFVGVASGDASQQAIAQAPDPGDPHRAVATFAGGCFWCVESDFDKVRGVISTTSGYTGGRLRNPTYEQVSSGGTGHAEAVQVVFDPTVVSYEQLLDHFWHNVDLFAANRQFCDVGEQYRAEVFVRGAAQRAAAEVSKQNLQRQFRQSIVVDISDAGSFYPAEAYHQDYHETHPLQYRFYRWNCGRDQRLAEIWGEK